MKLITLKIPMTQISVTTNHAVLKFTLFKQSISVNSQYVKCIFDD